MHRPVRTFFKRGPVNERSFPVVTTRSLPVCVAIVPGSCCNKTDRGEVAFARSRHDREHPVEFAQQDGAVTETNTDAHAVGWGTHHTSICIIYTTTHKHHAHFLSFGELVPRHDTAGLLGEVRRIRRWGWRCGCTASGSGHTRSTGWGNVSELKLL